jgi:Xaa-Pro aminopeptidase
MAHLPLAERDRRWALLQELLADEQLDVLVLAANDYRGHKGPLRWVGDLNLAHRYGYAIAAPDRAPRLLLPVNLAMNPRGAWDVHVTYARRVSDGLVDELKALGAGGRGRIGIAGLAQVMKVEDHEALRSAFPQAEIVDASLAFERIRAVKSAVELEGLREATRIAESCFERLLELAGPGVSERAIGAELAARALALGGEDLLFLTMYGRPAADGTVTGHFGQPAGRTLQDGDVLTFSFELVGPLGFWMEHARMVSIGAPDELQQRMNAAVRAGLEAGGAALVPGALPGAAQRAIVEAVAEHGASCTYWSGHGIGQDVIEEPWVGLDVVQERDPVPPAPLLPGMALSLHPFVIDDGNRAIGYMADTFVVGEDGPLSTVSRDLWSVR